MLGTLIGSSPRAFAYTALGDSVDDGASPLAIVAIGVVVVTGAVGALRRRAACGVPADALALDARWRRSLHAAWNAGLAGAGGRAGGDRRRDGSPAPS